MTIIIKTKIIDDHQQGNRQCVERTLKWGTSIVNDDHQQMGIAIWYVE